MDDSEKGMLEEPIEPVASTEQPEGEATYAPEEVDMASPSSPAAESAADAMETSNTNEETERQPAEEETSQQDSADGKEEKEEEKVEEPEPAPVEEAAESDVVKSEDKEEEETDKSMDQSMMDVSQNDSLNFTEKSINISQINVAQDDDSNDAFNALKESETDALNTKEEPVEHPEESEEPVGSVETPEPEPEVEPEHQDPEESTKEVESVDKGIGDDEQENAPEESQTEVDESREENEERAEPEAEPDAEPEAEKDEEGKTVEEPDEPTEEIGTTTEGEGVDENVCLLGDAEREITDADKERAVQASETVEEEEAAEETTAAEKEGETIEIGDTDEAEDAASEEAAEKEAEEQEHVEEAAEPQQSTPLKENEIREISEDQQQGEQICLNCENSAKCAYELLEDSGETRNLCTFNCVQEHREDNPDKYFLTQKKVYVHQVPESAQTCDKCSESKPCKFRFRSYITVTPPAPPSAGEEGATETPEVPEAAPTKTLGYKYLCTDKCLEDFIGKNTEKYVVKKKRYIIDEIQETEDDFKCIECNDVKKCKYKYTKDDSTDSYICHDDCLNLLLKEQPDSFRVKRRSVRVRELPKRSQPVVEETPAPAQEVAKIVARTDAEVEAARLDRDHSFIRRCAQCFEVVPFTNKSIQWETLDFCDEKCLGSYQNLIGAACTTCNNAVTMASLGKYCVRFGFDVKQFCCSACLDVYKKGLKQCTLCQRDLSGEENIVLAKVGEKGQFKDFCTQTCLKRYEDIINPKKKPPSHLCSVCNNQKPAKIEVTLEGGVHKFCSNPCFSAFKFVNNVFPDQCDMCTKYFERKSNDAHTIYHGDQSKMFCSKICMNIYIGTSREIWQCNWCKVSKYNYDMILRNFGKTRMCSLNCLTLFEVSVNALSRKR